MKDRDGGSDGARTRDLRRDRPTIYLAISRTVPTSSVLERAAFRAEVGTLFNGPLAEVTSYVYQQLASPRRLEALPAFEDFEVLRFEQVPQP